VVREYLFGKTIVWEHHQHVDIEEITHALTNITGIEDILNRAILKPPKQIFSVFELLDPRYSFCPLAVFDGKKWHPVMLRYNPNGDFGGSTIDSMSNGMESEDAPSSCEPSCEVLTVGGSDGYRKRDSAPVLAALLQELKVVASRGL
jgi:hypothetical protein